jgi:hypothetical protein
MSVHSQWTSAETRENNQMSIKGLALCGAALALASGVAFAQTNNNQNQPMQPSGGAGPNNAQMDPNATTSPTVNPPGSTPGSNTGGGMSTTGGSMGTSTGTMGTSTSGGMGRSTGARHHVLHHHVVHHRTHHHHVVHHHTTSSGSMGSGNTMGTSTTAPGAPAGTGNPGDQGSNPGGTPPH